MTAYIHNDSLCVEAYQGESKVKVLKKLSSVLLAGLIAAQTLLTGAITTTGVDSYYTGIPTIDGETSRTVDYIYDGVTRTDFVLGTSSKYSNHGGEQRFSTLEFDPAQDDLYLEVTGGTYISSQVKTSTAVTNYNNTHASDGKKAIAATNGDLWLMVNNRIFTSGTKQNVTKGYIVPMGFAMYGGELICTQDLTSNASYSFGVAADGTALIGELQPNIKATNQTTGTSITVDGINRTPEDGYLVMYTDKGFASNHSMNDAYEVIIDCDYDYTVNAGETITGKVTKITKPGGTKYNCTTNRIILTARGDDKIALLSDYSIGDTVSVKVDIKDLNGNTDKWYTVKDCVSGHFPHVINGVATEWPSGQNYAYPATIVGVKEDGNVIILTSYGRQTSTYSEGLWIGEMPKLLVEMGVKDAFMLDGGGSAAMVCENSSGAYELTGKTCDNNSSVLGTERSVVNNIILAVGPSKSGVGTTDITFSSDYANVITRNENNVNISAQNDGSLNVTATDYKNPSFYLDLLGGTSASTYKYMVIEGTPTNTEGGSFTLGIYPSAGRALDLSMSNNTKLTFNCDGTLQRKMVNLSTLDGWTGRMNFIRMDLFDDTGIANMGEGFNITRVKFFSSSSSATSYLNGTGETVLGDADGSGSLNLTDATLILKKAAGWSVTVRSQADFNRDGTINILDVTGILRKIAG